MSRLKFVVDSEYTSHPRTVETPLQSEDGKRYRLRFFICFGPKGECIELEADPEGEGTRNVGEPTRGEPGEAVQGSLQPEAGDGLRGDPGPEPDRSIGAGVMGISLSSSPCTAKDFRPGEGGATDDRGGGNTQASTVRSAAGPLALLNVASGVRVTMIATGS